MLELLYEGLKALEICGSANEAAEGGVALAHLAHIHAVFGGDATSELGVALHGFVAQGRLDAHRAAPPAAQLGADVPQPTECVPFNE